MKAVRFHETGAPEVLVFEDVPSPSPQPGEVLIRVEAIGVNFADVMQRRGDDYLTPTPTPFIPGVEVAGTVAALGVGVTSVNVNARVVALANSGGYAQFVCVPAARLIPLEDGITAVQAVTLLVQGMTAALALRNAGRLASGESVLIEGAAGGVGSFAVQLAKLFGAGKVIAVAGSPEKRAFAERLGADASIDYTVPGWPEKVRELTDGRGVDLVLESVGGDNVAQALEALATLGRMVFIGKSSGKTALINPWDLLAKNQTVTGFGIFEYLGLPDLFRSTLDEITGFVLSGKLTIDGGTVLPLARAAEAHRLLEGRESMGKIVLQPWTEA